HKGQIAGFLFIVFVGLSALWLLFAVFSFDFTKLYLKSAASLLYLLLIPVYLSFLVKQGYSKSRTKESIEDHLEALSAKGFVYKQGDRYFLTGKGRMVKTFLGNKRS